MISTERTLFYKGGGLGGNLRFPLLPRRVVLLVIRHVRPASLGCPKRLLHRSPGSDGGGLLGRGRLGRPSKPRRQWDGTLEALLLWHLESSHRLAHGDIGRGSHRLTHGDIGRGLIVRVGVHERVEHVGRLLGRVNLVLRLLLLLLDAALDRLGLLDPVGRLDRAVLLRVAILAALETGHGLQCGAAQLALVILDIVVGIGSLGQTSVLANLAEPGGRGNLADVARHGADAYLSICWG